MVGNLFLRLSKEIIRQRHKDKTPSPFSVIVGVIVKHSIRWELIWDEEAYFKDTDSAQLTH